MAQKKSPTAVRRQGFGDGMVVQAVSTTEASASHTDLQERLAIHRLVTRFGMLPATALAVAEANAWGYR